MGWSLDTIRPDLDTIFKNLGGKYEIQHPDSTYPSVFITYEADMPMFIKKHISNLFPDFVYLEFQRITFPADA